MHTEFSIFPALATARLNLRRLSADDAPAIYKLRSDQDIARLTGKEPFSSIRDAINYIQKIEGLCNEHACVFWGISYKDEPALIGTLCFWNFDLHNDAIEIGYELLPEFQKQGIMGEALAAIINFGFTSMEARIITAFPSAQNPASVNILEKLNFRLVPDTHNHHHENVPEMLTYVLYNVT